MAGSLAACGQAGSSGGTGSGGGSTAAAGAGCAPVAGADIVVLTDDKKLQNSDNVLPAINAKAATPALTAALDKVSAALDTASLISLNKQVDIDRKTSAVVATAFVTQKKLADGLQKGSGNAVIGAGNFSESQTLANIYADVLKAAGFTSSVKTIGNRELYLPALEKGEIQVVPEYAATLTEFLNPDKNSPKATPDIDKTIAALTPLGKAKGLTFGKPAAATDQNAFAVTTAFAQKNGVKTLSDFASKCTGKATVIGGPPECKDRPYCAAGLVKTYGLAYGSFTSLDSGGPLSKQALTVGKVSLALVFSSDGSLTQ
jgi:osmoprotectant transport system substrate-binding protein